MAAKFVTKAHLLEVATEGSRWDLPRQLRVDEVEELADVSYSIISATRIAGENRRCVVPLRRGCIIFDVPAATYRKFPVQETAIQ